MSVKFKAKGGSFRTGDLVFTPDVETPVEDKDLIEKLRKIDKLVEIKVKEETKPAAKVEEAKPAAKVEEAKPAAKVEEAKPATKAEEKK